MLHRYLQNITKTLTRVNRLSIYSQKAKEKQTGDNWRKNGRPNQTRKWSRFKISEFNTYFQQKMSQFDQQIKQIIQQLNNQSPRNSQIYRQIQSYLKTKENANFLASSSMSKVYLMVALQMRYNFSKQQLQQLRRLIVEHIIRHPMQNMVLDTKSLQSLVQSLCKYANKISQKYKLNVLIYFIINTLYTNFHNISDQFLPFIVTFISSNLKSYALDNLRYLKFVDLLKQKINCILINILNQQHSQEYKFVFQNDFIQELIQIYGIYGLSDEHIKNLHQFLMQRYLYTRLNNPSQATRTFNIIYRNFPHSKQNHKLQILQYISSLFSSNEQFNYEISKQSVYLCYSIVTHFFHSYYNSLVFQQQDGFTYLPQSSSICAPQLPDIFWKLYSTKFESINNLSIIKFTIKNCYPEQYIQSPEQSQPIKPTIDTEMNLRVDQSLKQLNIKYTTQQPIAGRFIDFYLYERKVVIEVDGVVHFEAGRLAGNDNTNYRNLHLLLSGYRLTTVSIYEYNVCRETEELSQLISKKIALLQQRALFVL